jgi:DNA-binding CsgD family transcriptional regulator
MDARSISETIGLAYDAALNPTGWRRFSAALQSNARCRLAAILFFDRTTPDQSFVVSAGLGNHFDELFTGQWQSDVSQPDHQDYLWTAVQAAPPDTVRHNLEFISAEDMRRTETWQRYGASWDMHHLVCGVVANNSDYSAYISLGRSAGDGEFLPSDFDELRGGFMAHVRRSLALHRTLARYEAEERLVPRDAEDSGGAFVIFNIKGEPLLVSRRAEDVLADQPFLKLARQGLHCANPAVQSQLDQSLAAARDLARGQLSTAPPPPIVVAGPAGPLLQVAFAPVWLPGDTGRLPAGAACIAIIQSLGALEAGTRSLAVTLGQRFDLTRAELRLCEQLSRGQALAEAAAALNVSRNTAKTHLGRIFAKTGTHSQAALMHLLAVQAAYRRSGQDN